MPQRTKNFTKIVFMLCFFVQNTLGQNNRITTYNTIGWYNYFGTFQLSKKIGIHTEYQWRRNNVITEWQQSLLRIGINFNLNPNVLFRAGYGWIETYPYGQIPLNAMGKNFTEHRIFQMVQLSNKEGIVEFSYRFMLEQRFVGRYTEPSLKKEDAFPFTNRLRFMFRLQIPLNGKEMKNKTPYIALYDEIFIGFGKNVNANIFDQNRLGAMLGYRINENIRIEAGYLSQILQYGRMINGQAVFQNNNGFITNLHFKVPFKK